MSKCCCEKSFLIVSVKNNFFRFPNELHMMNQDNRQRSDKAVTKTVHKKEDGKTTILIKAVAVKCYWE